MSVTMCRCECDNVQLGGCDDVQLQFYDGKHEVEPCLQIIQGNYIINKSGTLCCKGAPPTPIHTDRP